MSNAETESEAEDSKEYDSDALDDDSEAETRPKKRKRVSSVVTKTRSTRKKKKPADSDAEDEFELREGQEIVGEVVQAPKTGRGEALWSLHEELLAETHSVPPGQISQNTLDFLTQLRDPECNDREWYVCFRDVHCLADNYLTYAKV